MDLTNQRQNKMMNTAKYVNMDKKKYSNKT